MRVFVVMPFAERYDKIYTAIREACDKAKVLDVRADEIREPGPIINQIFNNITGADCIIGDISEKNPNVYYEIGIAHSMAKPTILLAHKNTINELPFDIRHNRVIVYDPDNLSFLVEKLVEHLLYLMSNIISEGTPPTIDKYLKNLTSVPEKPEMLLNEIANDVAGKFKLTDVRLVEEKFVEQQGYLLTFEDAFSENAVVLIDFNGIIRRMKKL